MKKVLLAGFVLIALLALSKCGYSQTWYGNNPTFSDGFVGSVNYTGTATITGNVTFTNGGSLSTVDIKNGGKLTLQQSIELYNGSLIESGGTLAAQQDLTFDDANEIDGTLTVAGTLSSNNQEETLSGCALINTKNLTVHNDNLFQGSGLIVITGTYNSENNNFHPLTASNTIYVNYSGAWTGFGSAQKSTSTTSPCNTVTPVLVDNLTITQAADKEVTATWTSTIESNVSYFAIQGSADGQTFVDVQKVASYWSNGTSSTPHTYNVTFDNAQAIAEAGIGGFVIILLVLSMSVQMGKRGPGIARILALFVISFAVHSCTKHNELKTSLVSKYQYFRLIEVDQDGTIHYVQQDFKVS